MTLRQAQGERDRAEAQGPQRVPFDLLASLVETGQIKALSIKQPYPHHIIHDDKDVENRDWPTRFRGWFIIHAGVSTSELASSQMHLPRGGIVGMARIVDCVEAMESRWFYGRYGFVLADAFAVDLIPCRGQLGFFLPAQEALTALSAALRGFASLRDTKSDKIFPLSDLLGSGQ